MEMINLAKFRISESDNFLGLGITADCSRNYKKGGSDDQVNPKSDDQAINLGKFLKDTSSSFLGLGIDTSSNYKINHGRPIIALNPTPLRSYHHTHGYMDYSAEHHEARASSNTCCAGKKRIREQTDNKNHLNAKKGPKRSRVDEYPEPINPPPELAQRIGPTARPVFVYRKQLVEWDTQKGQNRLFINDRKKLMDFLTEEERRAVEDDKKPGIDLVGIDSMGREYKLHSNKWESLNIAVLNKEWHKIVVANGAKKGDWLHLWAFRRGDADDQLCLYVDFRDQP